jgi:hypothetical protein
MCISSIQALCPSHQLSHPAAATKREGGGGSRPGDGGGGGALAGAAAIRGAQTCLPTVLAGSVVRVPRDTAWRTATSAPRDAAGHRTMTTPSAAASLPPLMQKILNFLLVLLCKAGSYGLRHGWSFTKKNMWLHTLGNWSNIKHNKI